jgi:eukaryotic-like serine/threonine-protein kinase
VRYRLDRLIANNGSAMVFAGMDTTLSRPVIVKMLSPHLAADNVARKRFIGEARALASMGHPNLVAIYDFVSDKEGALIVMERLNGRPLHQVLPKRGFATGTAFSLSIQIADALACLHRAGFVHRDLKPSNILVTYAGCAKLLDLGVVKSLSRAKRGDAITGKGLMPGTSGYMSPEQLCGRPVDGRSDIFSFGVLLCELLTGKRPFKAASPAETAAAILRDEPQISLARVPEGALRILARCLQKEPQDRYSTIHAVARELQTLRAAWRRRPTSN